MRPSRRPIDVFVHFEGKRATDMAPSRYAARHLISNEVQAELARRGESGEAITHTANDIISAYKVYVPPFLHPCPPLAETDPTSRARSKPPQALAAPTKAATDFFGRVIVPKAAPAPVANENQTASQAASLAVPVAKKKRGGHAVYKYHEGFSNAVRVTKRVGDFLGL